MRNRSFPRNPRIHLPALRRLGMVTVLCGGVLAATAETWTLERAVEHALAGNPDARIARHRIAAAQAGLDQARAAYWPQMQFQSSYSRTDNPVAVFGNILNQRAYSPALDFNDVPDSDHLNVRGLVTLPLYNGGRTRAGRDAAFAQTEAARRDAEAVRDSLAFEVARVFHTIQKTRAFIRATEAAVEALQGNLRIATTRFEGGTALRTEVLDLEVRVAHAHEDAVRARNAHHLAIAALRNVLGLEEADLSVTESTTGVGAPEPGEAADRPELASVRQRQTAAEAEVRRARGGHLPRVNAFTSLDYDEGWRTDGSGRSYTAGVLLQWDLWDGHLTRARVAEARAEAEAWREEERKLRLAIDLEVKRARLSLDEARERLAVTSKAIGLATESALLTRARFEQGLVLATQLIDAETALTVAQVRRAEAEADEKIAIAALRKALGIPQPARTPEAP